MKKQKFLKIEATRVAANYHLKLAKWFALRLPVAQYYPIVEGEPNPDFEEKRKYQTEQTGVNYSAYFMLISLHKSLKSVRDYCFKGMNSPLQKNHYCDLILKEMDSKMAAMPAFFGFDMEMLQRIEELNGIEKILLEKTGFKAIEHAPFPEQQLKVLKWIEDFLFIIRTAKSKGSFTEILKRL